MTGAFFASSARAAATLAAIMIVLDQPVRVEPVARGDRGDAALLVEHHAALGDVELERFALVAGGEQRAPARPQAASVPCSTSSRGTAPFDFGGIEQVGEETSILLLSRRIDRGLRILVGNVCGDANLGSRESPALERAVLRDLAGGRPSPPAPAPSFSEQMSADNSSGSIGTTRSGK